MKYSYFLEGDCILIEMAIGSEDIPDENIWEFASYGITWKDSELKEGEEHFVSLSLEI